MECMVYTGSDIYISYGCMVYTGSDIYIYIMTVFLYVVSLDQSTNIRFNPLKPKLV
jgi:hypothetical protein